MKHCLIIDHSPIIREVAASILLDLGHRVEEAENDILGIAHCRIEMPDIIFVDWLMADGAVRLFLEQLDDLSRLRKPYIVVLSTINDPEAFKLAQEAGADALLVKPFDRRELLEIADQATVAA